MPKSATKIFAAVQIIGFLAAVIAWTFFRGAAVSSAAQPKIDPCKQYQEKAKKYLEEAEEANLKWISSEYIARIASLSAANGSYYITCREMERNQK